MKLKTLNRWLSLFVSMSMTLTQALPYGYSQEATEQQKNPQGSYTSVQSLEEANAKAAEEQKAEMSREEQQEADMNNDPYLASVAAESPLAKVDSEDVNQDGKIDDSDLKIQTLGTEPMLRSLKGVQVHSKAEVEEMAAMIVRSYLGNKSAQFETTEWNHPFMTASDQVIDENNPTLFSPQQGSLKLTRNIKDASEMYMLTINDQGLQLSTVEIRRGDDLIRSVSFGYDDKGSKTSESTSEYEFDSDHNQIVSRSSWKNMDSAGMVTNESTSETQSKFKGKNLVYQISKSSSKYDNNGTPQTNDSTTILERVYSGEVIVSEKTESHSNQNGVEVAGSTSLKKVDLDANGKAVYSDTQSDSWSSYNGNKSEYHYSTTEKSAYNDHGDLIEKVTRYNNSGNGYSSSSESHQVNTYEAGLLTREETQSTSTYNGNQNSSWSTVRNFKRDAAGRVVFEESVSSYNGTVNNQQNITRTYLDEKSDKLTSEVTESFYLNGSALKLNYRQTLKLEYNKEGVLLKTHHLQESFYGEGNALSYQNTIDTIYNADGKPVSVITRNFGLDGTALVLQSTSDWKYRYSDKNADGKTHVIFAAHTELDAKGNVTLKETKRYDPLFSMENPNINEPRVMYDIAMPAYSYYLPTYWGWGGGLEKGLVSSDIRYFSIDADGELYNSSITSNRYKLDDRGMAVWQRTIQKNLNSDGDKTSQTTQEYDLFGQQYNYGCCYEMILADGTVRQGMQNAAGMRTDSIMRPYPYNYNSGRRLTFFDDIRYDESGEINYRKTQRNTYKDGLLVAAKMTLRDGDNVLTVKESYEFDALGRAAKITRETFGPKGELKLTDERTYEYDGFGYGYYPPIYYAGGGVAGAQTKMAGNSAIWMPYRKASVKSVNVHLVNHETGETVDAFLAYEQSGVQDPDQPILFDGNSLSYNQVRITGTYKNKEGSSEIDGVFKSDGNEHALPTEKLIELLKSYAKKPPEYKSDETLLSELHNGAKIQIYEEFDHGATACAPMLGAVCSNFKKVFYSYILNGDRVYQIASITERSIFGRNSTLRFASLVSEAELKRAVRAAGFHALEDLAGPGLMYSQVNIGSINDLPSVGENKTFVVNYVVKNCDKGPDCSSKEYRASVVRRVKATPEGLSYFHYEVRIQKETRLVVNYEGGQAYVDWLMDEVDALVRTDIKTGEQVKFVQAKDLMSCRYPKDGPALCADMAILPGYEQIGSYRKDLSDGGYEERIIMGIRADKNPPIEEKGSPVVTGVFHVPDDSLISTLQRSVYRIVGENQSWLIDRLKGFREILDGLDGQKVSFIPGKSFSLEGEEIFTSGIIITGDGIAFVIEDGKVKVYKDAQFVTISETRCPANPAMGAPCSVQESAMKMPGFERLHQHDEVFLDGIWVVTRTVVLIGLPLEDNDPTIKEKGSPVVTGIFQVPDDSLISTLQRSVYTVAGESASWLIDRLEGFREILDRLNGQKISFIPGKSFSLEGEEIFSSGIIITEDGTAFVFEEGKIKAFKDAQFVTVSEARCPANPAMGAPCSIQETAMKMPGYVEIHRHEEVSVKDGWVVTRTIVLIGIPAELNPGFIPVDKMDPAEADRIRKAVGDGLELLGVEIDDQRPVDGNLNHRYVFRAVSSSIVHMTRTTGKNLIMQDANGLIHEVAGIENFGLDIEVNDQIRYIREPDPREISAERGVSKFEVAPGEKIIISVVKEFGGRRLLNLIKEGLWNFIPVTTENGFTIKLAAHEGISMEDVHNLKLEMTGEAMAKCPQGSRCESFKEYSLHFEKDGEQFQAHGKRISATLNGQAFISYEVSDIEPVVKEDPLMISARSLIGMSFSEAFGMDDKTFSKAIKEGLIVIGIEKQDNGQKPAKFQVKVKLDASLARHLANGEVMLTNVLGAGILPESISFVVQEGLQMGAPCTISATGVQSCPPPSLELVSGEFRHQGLVYRLDYMGPTLQDDMSLKPMHGDSLLKRLTVTKEGPTSTTAVALIRQVSFERLDDGSIKAVISNSDTSVLIQRQMDGRLYVMEVTDSDNVVSKFSYVTAIADCAAPPPGVISNCGGAFVSLNEVVRSLGDSKLSVIQEFGWDEVASNAVVIRIDNEMKKITFNSVEQLLALAKEFENSNREKKIAAAIEASGVRINALIAEMKIPEDLTEDEFNAMQERLKKYEAALRGELQDLKKILDAINNTGANANGGLIVFGGGPEGAIKLEQLAARSLGDFYAAIMQANLIMIQADGTKVRLPVKAMTETLLSLLPGGRWGSTPEDYQKLLGFKPEFHPGDGIYVMNVFQFITFQLANGPSYRDLRTMVIRFVRESGAKNLIRDGKVDLQAFRRALLGIDAKISDAIKAARERILKELKLEIPEALTEEQVKALLEQNVGLYKKMAGMLTDLKAEIDEIENSSGAGQDQEDPARIRYIASHYGPPEAQALESEIQGILWKFQSDILAKDVLIPSPDGTLVRLPMKELTEILSSVVGKDLMGSFDALQQVLGFDLKQLPVAGPSVGRFSIFSPLMMYVMAYVPNVRAAIIQYVKSSDVPMIENGKINLDAFRLSLMGIRAKITDAVSEAYMKAASDAGVAFFKKPEIKILSMKLSKKDGGQMVLDVTYSADSGPAPNAPNAVVSIAQSSQNLPVVTVLSIQTPFENQNREAMVKRVLEDLGKQLSVDVSSLKLKEAAAVNWNDSCLGVQGTGMCLMVITPGFKIILTDGKKDYEYHTDRNSRFVLVTPIDSGVQPLKLAALPLGIKAAYKGSNAGSSLISAVKGYGSIKEGEIGADGVKSFDLIADNRASATARSEFTFTAGKPFSLDKTTGIALKGSMKSFMLTFVDVNGQSIQQLINLKNDSTEFLAGIDLSKNPKFDPANVVSFSIVDALVRARTTLKVSFAVIKDQKSIVDPLPEESFELPGKSFDASRLSVLPQGVQGEVFGTTIEEGKGQAAFASLLDGTDGKKVSYFVGSNDAMAGYEVTLGSNGAANSKTEIALKGDGKAVELVMIRDNGDTVTKTVVLSKDFMNYDLGTGIKQLFIRTTRLMAGHEKGSFVVRFGNPPPAKESLVSYGRNTVSERLRSLVVKLREAHAAWKKHYDERVFSFMKK